MHGGKQIELTVYPDMLAIVQIKQMPACPLGHMAEV
jgi:hypothetical protein